MASPESCEAESGYHTPIVHLLLCSSPQKIAFENFVNVVGFTRIPNLKFGAANSGESHYIFGCKMHPLRAGDKKTLGLIRARALFLFDYQSLVNLAT